MENLRSSRYSLSVNDVLQNRLAPNYLIWSKNLHFIDLSWCVVCIIFRFLDDNDAEIQTNVLQCLLSWNDYLLPHRSHLENLIKPEELREELTTWNLSKDIEEAQRPLLVSLVIRILMPKVRNLKNSASRKVHNSILLFQFTSLCQCGFSVRS